MKEKDALIDSKEHQIVLYVEKEDGSYGTVRTGAYMISAHGDDFRKKSMEAQALCAEKVRKGELSPIGFFITLFGMIQDAMAVPDVAARVGLSPSAVKKHMHPRHFENVTVGQLKRYADVFGVPLPALFNPLAKPGADPSEQPSPAKDNV